MYSYGKTTPPPPQEPLPQGDQPPRGRGLKNPAVRSMITLLGYVVLLIAMWALLGKLLFPTQSTREKLANLVAQNRNLLVQLAESADDPALLTSLESTETVRDLFEAGNIRAVHAEDGRVRFELAGEDGVGEALVYIADDQYALLDEGDWQPAEVGANGVLRWEEAGGASVEVARLEESFFFEQRRPADA